MARITLINTTCGENVEFSLRAKYSARHGESLFFRIFSFAQKHLSQRSNHWLVSHVTAALISWPPCSSAVRSAVHSSPPPSLPFRVFLQDVAAFQGCCLNLAPRGGPRGPRERFGAFDVPHWPNYPLTSYTETQLSTNIHSNIIGSCCSAAGAALR